jgi:hypothetical protein
VWAVSCRCGLNSKNIVKSIIRRGNQGYHNVASERRLLLSTDILTITIYKVHYQSTMSTNELITTSCPCFHFHVHVHTFMFMFVYEGHFSFSFFFLPSFLLFFFSCVLHRSFTAVTSRQFTSVHSTPYERLTLTLVDTHETKKSVADRYKNPSFHV